jgi:hypothetical protein
LREYFSLIFKNTSSEINVSARLFARKEISKLRPAVLNVFK